MLEAPSRRCGVLLRTREQLVREQASHVQQIQKTLEGDNLKLASVLTQIMGVSGRAILQDDPDKLFTLIQLGVNAPPERLRVAPRAASPIGTDSYCACICATLIHSISPLRRSMRR